MNFKNKKVRFIYLLLFCILFVLEVLIALFARDDFIRPYAGDILVSIAICCFIRGVFFVRSPFLSLYVFMFASVVEIGQYFDYVSLFGIGHIPFFKVLLGATFSVGDLICYAFGCAFFFVSENIVFSGSVKKFGD